MLNQRLQTSIVNLVFFFLRLGQFTNLTLRILRGAVMQTASTCCIPMPGRGCLSLQQHRAFCRLALPRQSWKRATMIKIIDLPAFASAYCLIVAAVVGSMAKADTETRLVALDVGDVATATAEFQSSFETADAAFYLSPLHLTVVLDADPTHAHLERAAKQGTLPPANSSVKCPQPATAYQLIRSERVPCSCKLRFKAMPWGCLSLPNPVPPKVMWCGPISMPVLRPSASSISKRYAM